MALPRPLHHHPPRSSSTCATFQSSLGEFWPSTPQVPLLPTTNAMRNCHYGGLGSKACTHMHYNHRDIILQVLSNTLLGRVYHISILLDASDLFPRRSELGSFIDDGVAPWPIMKGEPFSSATVHFGNLLQTDGLGHRAVFEGFDPLRHHCRVAIFT